MSWSFLLHDIVIPIFNFYFAQSRTLSCCNYKIALVFVIVNTLFLFEMFIKLLYFFASFATTRHLLVRMIPDSLMKTMSVQTHFFIDNQCDFEIPRAFWTCDVFFFIHMLRSQLQTHYDAN